MVRWQITGKRWQWAKHQMSISFIGCANALYVYPNRPKYNFSFYIQWHCKRHVTKRHMMFRQHAGNERWAKKTVDDNNDAITFHRKKTYSWCWMSIDNLWSQVKIRAISSYRYNKRTQLFLNVLYLVSIHQAVHTNGSSATTSTVWPCTFNIFKVYQQLEVQKRTIKNELKLWPKSGTEFTRNAHILQLIVYITTN